MNKDFGKGYGSGLWIGIIDRDCGLGLWIGIIDWDYG